MTFLLYTISLLAGVIPTKTTVSRGIHRSSKGVLWTFCVTNVAFKTGPQMFAIKSMIDRLTQPRDQDAGRETARSSEL
jgi:hypothetical protein